MKVRITASKSGDFSKSKAHDFFYDDESGIYRNIHNPSQGIDFLDAAGDHEELQWMITAEDRRGRIRKCRFIGRDSGADFLNPQGFEGMVKIEKLTEAS